MRIALVFSATLLLIAGTAALAQETLSLDSLLETVKTGRAQDAKENAARLAAFKANKAEQQNLLGQAQAARIAGEARSKELEAEFEANDLRVV